MAVVSDATKLGTLTIHLLFSERWASPYINHFIQPDTIIPDQANPQSWNRYAYVRNNPIQYNDPTGHMESCEEGDSCQHPYSVAVQNVEYQDKTMKASKKWVSNALTNASIALDNLSLIINFFEAGISDFAIGGSLLLSAAQPELAPELIGGALTIDTIIAGPINPIADVENMLGGISFSTTALNDMVTGNTSLLGGYVGKDTIVAGRNALLGGIPESNIDLAVGASQLKYDMDRLNGVKPGGSVRFSDLRGLRQEVFWNDSPFQDGINKIRQWGQFLTTPYSP